MTEARGGIKGARANQPASSPRCLALPRAATSRNRPEVRQRCGGGFRPGGEPRPCPPSRFEALAVDPQGDDDAVFGPVAAQGAAELGGHGAVHPLSAAAALYRIAWDTSVLKDAASGSLRTLRGVTGVSNKVAIKPRPNAGDIKAHIMSALTRSLFKPGHVDVTASNGKVTLTVKVNTW